MEKNKNNWEIEFDEKFCSLYGINVYDASGETIIGATPSGKIKSFIHNLLSQRDKEYHLMGSLFGEPLYLKTANEAKVKLAEDRLVQLDKAKATLDELTEKIEGMKNYLPPTIDLESDAMVAVDALRNQGWNSALEEVLRVIKQ